jgi:hypothetical protein
MFAAPAANGTPVSFADVVGAVRTDGDRGRHGVGRPPLRARGEDRERRNGAIRRDAEQCVRPGVRDDPASRLGKQAVRVAVERSATRIRRELVRGDVSNRPPAAARRQVYQPSELLTDVPEHRPRQPLAAPANRDVATAAAEEGDVVRAGRVTGQARVRG